MRILLTSSAKKELFLLLKMKYNCFSIRQLSNEMNINLKTLQGWFYLKSRYIPESILTEFKNLKIIDKKEDKWGQVKGGNISYKNVVNKFGMEEIKRKQSLGGKRAAKSKEDKIKKNFYVNLNDPLFLEFYGNLLGDGWLSNFYSGGKKVWLIGISCNLLHEKPLVENYRLRVNKLFNRNRKIRERLDGNVAELIFSHKILLKYLNKELDFPIGRKENLSIHKSIFCLGYEKIKHVIRGIFDTDGTFYLGRNRKGIPSYPIIAIHMNEPLLIRQIGETLKRVNFRISYSNGGKMVRLQGKEQLKKWMEEIGSSNPYKLHKMQNALVAQSG